MSTPHQQDAAQALDLARGILTRIISQAQDSQDEPEPELPPVVMSFLQAKSAVPDALLLYRQGEYYEMRGQDAWTAAKALHLCMTTKNNGPWSGVPVCGFPAHVSEVYLAQLLEHGHKVAVCDQVEDPTRGTVTRAITRVLTPARQ